jgi:hypothetical protein
MSLEGINEMKNTYFLEKWKETSHFKGFCISLLCSLFISAVILVISFLSMIFASAKDGMRYSFLHLLYFHTKTLSDGSIDISFGTTGKVIPLILMMTIITCFIFAVFSVAKKLLLYRESLLNEKHNAL